MKTLAPPYDEKFLECVESLATVESSLCSSMYAVTDLLEAINRRFNVGHLKKEELNEARDYIVTMLHSLSDIQNITLRQTKTYANYLNKHKIKYKYEPKYDLERYKTIQGLTETIKSDPTFVSDYRENLIPTLHRISNYYHEKENLLGAKIISKGQSSPPWISKPTGKRSKARR